MTYFLLYDTTTGAIDSVRSDSRADTPADILTATFGTRIPPTLSAIPYGGFGVPIGQRVNPATLALEADPASAAPGA